ncbi:26S proteasome non-ATPase regulatory subunit [Pelomyxa schiedti]|nr:26S proteasome non-ATPase regulatory subunit [Pelomyxa schiedti]
MGLGARFGVVLGIVALSAMFFPIVYQLQSLRGEIDTLRGQLSNNAAVSTLQVRMSQLEASIVVVSGLLYDKGKAVVQTQSQQTQPQTLPAPAATTPQECNPITLRCIAPPPASLSINWMCEDKNTGNPTVYFVIGHRNRPYQLLRLLVSISQVKTEARICKIGVVVADAKNIPEDGSAVNRSDIMNLIEQWSGPLGIDVTYVPVNITGSGFVKARALRSALEYLNVHHPNSIMFAIDVDMLIPPNFVNLILSKVVKGRNFFAPVPWSLYEGMPVTMDEGSGWWRETGYGNAGFFVSDGIANDAYVQDINKHDWGSEDEHLVQLLSSRGLRLNRERISGEAVVVVVDQNLALFQDICKNMGLIEKALATKETRFITRCIRQTPQIRRRLYSQPASSTSTSATTQVTSVSGSAVLRAVIDKYCAQYGPLKTYLVSFLEPTTIVLPSTQPPSTDTDASKPTASTTSSAQPTRSTGKTDPELLVYIHLLICMNVIDRFISHSSDMVTGSVDPTTEMMGCCKQLVGSTRGLDTVADAMTAKCWFYYARAAELSKMLPSIRSELLAAYRTATLRHMDETKATVVNLLLRNYLMYNLYDQADKLVSKVPVLTDQSTSASQLARYLYYQGKIKSMQLDYGEAYKFLQQAQRKAPQSAKGFHLSVLKLLCIVQQLLGEIPSRSTFGKADGPLSGYLAVTNAVRVGDLAAFRLAVDSRKAEFEADGTYSLILRLRHNVIKAGLRKVCMSYSRISLSDVAAKLHLDSVQDCEFIVAKAIRDGVIDATIDHEGGFIQSKENLDIYSTQEPRNAFHQRITFCLNIHNEAVKAMRFAPDAHKPKPLQTTSDSRAPEIDDDDDDF